MVVGDKGLISPRGPGERMKCLGKYFMFCKVIFKEGPKQKMFSGVLRKNGLSSKR